MNPTRQASIYHSEYYNHVQYREHPLRFFLDKDFERFLLSQPQDTIFHFHSVFIPWFLPAVKLLKAHGYRRVVLTPHGQYTDEAMSRSLKKRVFFRFFDRRILRTVDAVQMIGRSEENCYLTDNARERHLIPNGCDAHGGTLAPAPKQLTFGYLGRIEVTQKGIDTMMRAFAFHLKTGGKGTLRIAGDGKDRQAMETLCRELGISDRVEFAGKVFGEEKWRFLQGCAWFLHPSRWDVIPTACMEAAACGVPLIVSRETNLDPYIAQFRSGLVMRADNRPVQALAELLRLAEKVFGQSEEYQTYRSNSLKMIVQRLNWNQIAQCVLSQLYAVAEHS